MEFDALAYNNGISGTAGAYEYCMTSVRYVFIISTFDILCIYYLCVIVRLIMTIMNILMFMISSRLNILGAANTNGSE